MNPACKTIYWFGFYPLLAGLSMILAPTLPLELMGWPVEGLDWIRMLGVVTMIVGYYYINLGKENVLAFCRYSAQMRLVIPGVFALLVVVYDMNPLYIALTSVDFLGGLWTASALRRQGMTVFSAKAA